jgi:hypothetical protein
MVTVAWWTGETPPIDLAAMSTLSLLLGLLLAVL